MSTVAGRAGPDCRLGPTEWHGVGSPAPNDTAAVAAAGPSMGHGDWIFRPVTVGPLLGLDSELDGGLTQRHSAAVGTGTLPPSCRR